MLGPPGGVVRMAVGRVPVLESTTDPKDWMTPQTWFSYLGVIDPSGVLDFELDFGTARVPSRFGHPVLVIYQASVVSGDTLLTNSRTASSL